jgi:hypothetical protein
MKLMVRSFWRRRRETLEQCATRIEHCLFSLRQCNTALSQWVSSETESPVPDSAERIVEFLEGCRHVGDDGVTVYQDLGYSVGFRNDIGFCLINVGADATPSPNRFYLEIEDVGSLADPQDTFDLVRRITEAVAACWQPSWGDVVTREILREHKLTDNYGPGPALLLFLERRRGSMPSLPDKFLVTNVPSHGYLVCNPGAFNEGCDQVAEAKSLISALKAAGGPNLEGVDSLSGETR